MMINTINQEKLKYASTVSHLSLAMPLFMALLRYRVDLPLYTTLLKGIRIDLFTLLSTNEVKICYFNLYGAATLECHAA